MKKIIISCPNCHQKMKIQTKAAKYRCPHCSAICIISLSNLLFFRIQNTFSQFFSSIKRKFENIKNTYRYVKMMQEQKKKR